MKFRLVISPDEDEEIVASVHKRCELTDKIERLVRSYTGDSHIAAYSEERDSLCSLDYDEIECISVENGKTVIIASDGDRYVSRMRLYEIEKSLPSCFIRINKSAIGNSNLIKEYSASFSGAVNVHFRSGYVEYVSRRCFADIKRRNRK